MMDFLVPRGLVIRCNDEREGLDAFADQNVEVYVSYRNRVRNRVRVAVQGLMIV